MYAQGVKIAPCDQNALDDGYVRTFRKLPEFSDIELNMLYEWKNLDKLDEIAIFLTSEKFKDLDDEMAGFVFRELMRGNL